MIVDLSRAGASALEVSAVVESALTARGFRDMGRSGRDEIQNTRTAFMYEGPSDLTVIVDIDRATTVPIRVNQDRKTFSPEATAIFDEIMAAVDAKWPNSVIAEPTPTK